MNKQVNLFGILYIALGCSFFLAGGCSSAPSPNDAEAVLRAKIDSDSQAKVKLISFKKTDGQMSVVNDVKMYELDYQAEIEFETDGTWIKGYGETGMDFAIATGSANPGSMAAFANQFQGGIEVHQGDRVIIDGVMRGNKKESGWKFELGSSQVRFGPANQSVQELHSKAESGDAAAEADLARDYFKGTGVVTNYLEAIKWAKKSADQANADGEYLYGFALQRGLGVEKDQPGAINWYRKAAEQGSIKAQTAYGFALEFGIGVEKNESEAVNWYRKAAEQGFADAEYRLGLALSNSQTPNQAAPTNPSEAAQWFQKAASQGQDNAMMELGEMYAAGKGVARNSETAFDYFKKAAAAGNKRAQERVLAIQKAGGLKKYAEGTVLRNCANNLKQIGIALRIWSGDNHDQLPFNVSTNDGGSMEFCERDNNEFDRNSFLHFQVMSNELGTTKILICPGDSAKSPALDFKSLSSSNVSYEIRSGRNINMDGSKEIIVRCPIHGEVLYADGSVGDGSVK